MSWVAAAVVGSAVVGGVIASDSSRKAVNSQRDATNASNDLQKEMYDQTRTDQTPFREASYGALGQIQNLLKDPSSIAQQPGYQFGLDQGTRALNAGAAARGMNYSGAQAKALTRYGQDYAGTKLNETYNRLSNLAGLGQVAANGQNNQNYAGQVGNNLTNFGNAQAGASMYNGRIWSNVANQLGSSFGGKFGGGGYGPNGSQGNFSQWGGGGGFGSGTGGMGD